MKEKLDKAKNKLADAKVSMRTTHKKLEGITKLAAEKGLEIKALEVKESSEKYHMTNLSSDVSSNKGDLQGY